MHAPHLPFVIRIPLVGRPVAGPLQGLAFAVKDNMDVAGLVTGNGNPHWATTHPVPSVTASAVRSLEAAGAALVGKVTMDELAFGLTGRNTHYGTPTNPAAPGRVPGGSSSGSASAVAAAQVDFALGTDTGGSVRIPSSFCGLWGFRPTHGRVSMEGVVPLAPSFDTVGCMARDARVLERVGSALLDGGRAVAEETPAWNGVVLVAEDLFEHCSSAAASALERALGLLDRGGARVTGLRLAQGTPVQEWVQAFRILQGREIWTQHRDWYETVQPTVAPDVAARMAIASRVGGDEERQAQGTRDEAARLVRHHTREGAWICLPTAPFAALPLDFPAEEMEAVRGAILALTCPAVLAGAPQVTIPAVSLEGCPLGLSLMAHPSADRGLLARARDFAGPGSSR